jgi:hypothetical protein
LALSILAVLVGAFFAPSIPAQTWTLETVAGPTDVHDFAIDGLGTLHVLHANAFSSLTPELVYIFDSGSGWQQEVVPGIPAPNLIGLATDAVGIPHITFVDTAGTVQYGSRNGSPWAIESLPPPTAYPYNPQIALDGSGQPHIAYITYGDRIRHVFRSSGVWTDEEVDGSFLSASHSRAAIAVGTDGIVRIASRDYFDDVAYFTRIAGSWTEENFGEWGYTTALVLDKNNHAHLVYTGNGVHYASNESGSWAVEEVDLSFTNDCDVAIDENGEPYIVYEDTNAIRYQNPDLYYHTDVYLAYRVGGVWQRELVDAAHDYIGGYGWVVRIAFDGSGIPHVVYRDASMGMLKHGTRNWPTAVDDEPRHGPFGAVSVVPNPFNPSTTISFRLPARSRVEVAVYDARGRRLRLLSDRVQGPGHHSEIWDGLDDGGAPVASGVYFVRIKTPAHSDVRRAVLLK